MLYWSSATPYSRSCPKRSIWKSGETYTCSCPSCYPFFISQAWTWSIWSTPDIKLSTTHLTNSRFQKMRHHRLSKRKLSTLNISTSGAFRNTCMIPILSWVLNRTKTCFLSRHYLVLPPCKKLWPLLSFRTRHKSPPRRAEARQKIQELEIRKTPRQRTPVTPRPLKKLWAPSRWSYTGFWIWLIKWSQFSKTSPLKMRETPKLSDIRNFWHRSKFWTSSSKTRCSGRYFWCKYISSFSRWRIPLSSFRP